MPLYSTILLLSAFLLFVVQPLIGKVILPWFGGTPAVWTACMLFFQAFLLAGYGYAHFVARSRNPRTQLNLHALVLALSLLALPIIPSPMWKPEGAQSPLFRITGLLLATVGAPYFVLAGTSPLLQSWFARETGDRSPYRLYSLSNLGSLLAICSYPFVIEPFLSLRHQIQIWSWSYAFFALLGILLVIKLRRLAALPVSVPQPEPAPPARAPSAGEMAMWLSLAACGSILLLATTNQLCMDAAVVPLLWVLPLALYLLTFIICFSRERWYSRLWSGPVLAGALVQTCVVLFGSVYVSLPLQIASYSFTLFVACMVCHGELVRLKPDPRHLTSYYLMIAGGGALGGFFVSVVAPYAFRGFWEYHFSLVLTAFLFLSILFHDRKHRLAYGRPLWAWAVLYASLAALVVALMVQISDTLENNLAMTRNFFGVLRVISEDTGHPDKHYLTLMHGRIEHGSQFTDPEKRHWPTTYYGPDSGAGIAILNHPLRQSGDDGDSHLRIGVIGLGAGTIAAYGEEHDLIRFYEINPAVVRLSGEFFTYRKDSAARVEIELGDARISMERERQAGGSALFDVLIVDAFSSDAIPVHLLTRECFRLYLYHLEPDGVLAVHISNRYFDFSPVVRGVARLPQARGFEALQVNSEGNEAQGTDSTHWVLLTRNQDFLNSPAVQRAVQAWPDDSAPQDPWTDDYSNLFRVLRH